MTSFHHIQEGTTTLLWKNILYPMFLVKHGREKFRAPSLSTGIRVEKKRKKTTTVVFLSQLDLYPPFCHLHIISIRATKRLEKYKLGFLKGENLSVLLYLFSRFFNYMMSTYRIISHL